MAVRVAVRDPLPLFRNGVIAALGDLGHRAETPDDVLAWARRAERRVVLLTVLTADDWTLLADLCRTDDDLLVLALLERADVADYVRAVTSGAVGAVPRRSADTEIRAAFHAVLRGQALLPIDVVRVLATRRPDADVAEAEPSAREIGWLRDLSRGVSVSRLADASGYSERMMFRLLRELYTRLGVENRTSALILARDRRWI